MATAGRVTTGSSSAAATPTIELERRRREAATTFVAMAALERTTAGGSSAPSAQAAATAAIDMLCTYFSALHLGKLEPLFEGAFKGFGKFSVEQVCILASLSCATKILKTAGEMNQSQRGVLISFIRHIEEKKWRTGRANIKALVFAMSLSFKNQSIFQELALALQAIDALLDGKERDFLVKDLVQTSDETALSVEFCAGLHLEWARIVQPLLLYFTEQMDASWVFPSYFVQFAINKRAVKKSDDPLNIKDKSESIARCGSYFVKQCGSEMITYNNHLVALYQGGSTVRYFHEKLLDSLATIDSFAQRRLHLLVTFLNEYLLHYGLGCGVVVRGDQPSQANVTRYCRDKLEVKCAYFRDVAAFVKKLRAELTVNHSQAKSFLSFLFSEQGELKAQTQLFESLTQVKGELQTRREKLRVDMEQTHIKHFRSFDAVFSKYTFDYQIDPHREFEVTLNIVDKVIDTCLQNSFPMAMNDFVSHVYDNFIVAATVNEQGLDELIVGRNAHYHQKTKERIKERYVLGKEGSSGGELYCKELVALRTCAEELRTCHSPIHLFFHGLFKILLAEPSLTEEELLKNPLFFTEVKSRPKSAPVVEKKEKSEKPEKIASTKVAVVAAAAIVQPEEIRIFKLLSSLLFRGEQERILSYHLNHIQWSLELSRAAAQTGNRRQLTEFVPSLIYHLYLVLEISMNAKILEEGETRLFHGLVRIMRHLGFTKHLDKARLIDYGSFWFRFPHSSRDNYSQGVPRVLQLMIDLETPNYDCMTMQREVETLVQDLLPLLSPSLHINMVETPSSQEKALPKRLQKVVAKLEQSERALIGLLASYSQLLGRSNVKNALTQLIRLKELVKAIPLYPIQRYYSRSTDKLLTYCYLVVQLMGEAFAKEGGVSLRGVNDIERHWEELQLEGKIEGLSKAQIRELNLQKAGDDPTSVPEFMEAYEFACAVTEGGEGMVPFGFSEKRDLYHELCDKIERRVANVSLFVDYILGEIPKIARSKKGMQERNQK